MHTYRCVAGFALLGLLLLGACGPDSDPNPPSGSECTADADCQGGSCADGVCVSCFDTVKNGSEGDVDCGGTCAQKCSTNQGCNVGSDCASGACASGKCAAPTCMDGVKNGLETDVDCGGTTCATKCAAGKACKAKSDCSGTLNCVNGTCM